MEYIDFIVKQSGRNLTLLDSSKIIINKYDHKVARIVFELDDTIPGRFYFAMKNPITGKYTFVPIIKNHIVIGTNISAYPGRWDSILVAVADDYEITEDDIDQSKFTYVCNTFRRIIVRDNFLNETDEEEIENPAFTEMLEALVKAQDRLENASIEAVEAADSAKADRESVAELIDQINDINTSVEELQDYIDAIKAIRNEVRDYKYEVEDVYEESKQILITINARLDSVEELASEVATNKAHVQEAINTFDQSYNDRFAEMQNAFDEYIADVNKAQTDAITEITDACKDVKADVDKSVDAALIAVTTQESNSVEAVNEAKTAAIAAVNTASATGVKNVTDKETSALAAIEAKQNESTDEIASAKETALADLSAGKDEYVELIDAEKQAAINAVKDSVQNTVDEVAAVKDDAIQGVLDESEVQQNLIAVKTQEALDSIPDTYEEVYEMAREGAEKADAIVCEASGEVIVVNDASDDYLRGLKIYGKTEQKTYSGKNLAPVSSISYATYDEKTGTINSATTSNTAEQWAKIMLFKDSTNVKTAWYNYGDNTLGLKVAKLTKDDTFNRITVGFNGNMQDSHIFLDCSSLVNGETYKVVFNVNSLSNNASVMSGIMVVNNSITDYSYEPYTGGQASPNPAYQQTLESKGKWGNLAKSYSANYENVTQYQNVLYVDFDLKPSTTYTLSFISEGGNTVYINENISQRKDLVIRNGLNTITFTTVANVDSNQYGEGRGWLLFKNAIANTVTHTFEDIMLNEGTTALPYRPYSGQQEVEVGVYGKNLYTQDLFKDDDYVLTNGYYRSKNPILKAGNYIWSGKHFQSSVEGITVRLTNSDRTKTYPMVGASALVQQTIIQTTEDLYMEVNYAIYGFNASCVLEGQIERGTVATECEPYSKQPLISLVGNGLNGIEVSDPSLATYTDEDGKMWCSDYVDCERGVLVRNIKAVVLDGTESWYIQTGTNNEKFTLFQANTSLSGSLNQDVGQSSHFKYINFDRLWSLLECGLGVSSNKASFRIKINNDIASTVDELKTWLADNPVTVVYPSEELIETPMSAEEISAFKALRSNSPTTTLMNDCDCFSSLSYNADTKTYIINNTPEPSEESITSAVNAYLDENPVSMVETDPTVPAWAKQATKPSYTATEVGADASGTAASLISSHNVNTESHNDLRILLSELSEKVTTLLNSDDTTLDQTKEIVDYIKANRELIESVTTEKVNVTDIINNLTTNISTKVLSAAQGVALKLLIDDITEALNAHNHDTSYGSKTDVENLQADVSALKNIVNTSSITLVDASTGVIYQIVINNGKLTMMEVK